MSSRLPPLNALRAFEVASRVGSFTVAARELHVSQGAISRHIAHLEEHLGVQLFDRSHREVRLTPLGAIYANDIGQAFARIIETTRKLHTSKNLKTLKVALFPSIASHWLMPRLARFHALYPEINLAITTTRVPPDIEREDVDIANFHGDPLNPSIEYHKLLEITLQPVVCPGLINGSPGLAKPTDLLKHNLLQSLNRPGDWPIWLERAGVSHRDLGEMLKFENSALACQAAADGAGVALALDLSLLEGDLAAGRLVAPFDLRVKTGESYGIGWLARKAASPTIEAFRTWLQQEMQRPTVASRSATKKRERDP
jgi:LysR family glycine cleavage system transcriptional activator